MTYCPHDGWEEHETEAEARSALDGILDRLQDEANDEGWRDDAEQARLVRATTVASLRVQTVATAEDDSPEGELCRARGWDELWDGSIEEATSPPGVFQTIIDNERGNCEAACVATILGLGIDDVPNFADPKIRDSRLWLREWVHTQGYGIVETKGDTTPHDYVYTGLHRLIALATVPSQMIPDCRHAVVVGWRDHPDHPGALQCYVVHDPNPHNAPYDSNQIIRLRWFVPHMLPEVSDD
jgi:hypothetical protein